MTKSLKKSVLAAASALTALTAIGAASAQSFGGLPTVTPQAQAERARRAAQQQDQTYYNKKEKRPSYVVVDKGGPGGGRDRHNFTTIQEAVDAVAWGGVVVVMPGIYEENVVLSRAISLQGDRGAGSGVEIIPTEANKPCLSFQPTHFNDHAMVSNITFRPGSRLSSDQNILPTETAAVNRSADATPCVDVEGGIFTMVESTVDGAGAHRGDLVHISGGTALLEKNQLTGGRRGIAVAQNHALWDRALLIDNIVSNNLVEGVHLDGVSSVLATGNLVNRNGDGIVYNGRGTATLVGNKILDNSGHGVLLDQDAHQVLVRLNQIWSNKGDGIKVYSSSGLIEDNDIDGNVGMEISTIGHFESVPTIINDVRANEKSPKRGGWALNQPRDHR